MRWIARILGHLFVLFLFVPACWAQAYPSKLVRIVIPFPPGGPADMLCRLVGQQLSERWSQPVICDNRPGANTIIGAEAVVKAPADGYTLLLTVDSTMTVNPLLYSNLSYDPLRDLAPITLVGLSRIVIVVNAATGPKSLPELVQFARANPGKADFAAGTITDRLAGELLKSQLGGLDIIFIPYNGSAATLRGLFSDGVTFLLVAASAAMPYITSGQFRAIATTGAQRIASLPEVPTVAESVNLPGFDFSVWMGVFAPAGTPAEIVQQLNRDITQIMDQPKIRERLALIGLDVATNSPAEFAEVIRKETERWLPVIRQGGIKAD
jgi:tripartite-type tricarboxylate transporter receptor subunit TctC